MTMVKLRNAGASAATEARLRMKMCECSDDNGNEAEEHGCECGHSDEAKVLSTASLLRSPRWQRRWRTCR
ncbi:hypothetical protein Nepgr_003542 [Nepenthes gracilis]|uniref:Uncharacterized protein n=1 Tax=Nepenthes gracilis TaxID=150966 RepID=A0AAD3RZP2_NEPGR|nr:hypothetical protein Nepgr_003542 [Nepenthes gracilis]